MKQLPTTNRIGPITAWRQFFALLRCPAVLTILLASRALLAQDYSWNTNSTTTALTQWSINTNWSPTAPVGGPDAAGVFVLIGFNVITPSRTVTLFDTGSAGDAIKTVGRLDIGDTNGSTVYKIVGGTGGGILDFDGNGVDAQLNQLSTSAGDRIGAPITLTSSLQISNATAASPATALIIVGDISGAGGITKQGPGTVIITDVASTYTGTTTVNTGTLELTEGAKLADTTGVTVNSGGTLLFSGTGGTDNKLNTAANVTLAGGTLNTGGLDGLDQHVGALSLTANSVIDFAALGTGSQSLHFTSASGSWSGLTLSIWNWTMGIDHLYFGTDSTGLDGARLSQIYFYGGSGTGFLGTAKIALDGELSPIPEPSTIFALLGLAGVIGWRERKRLRGVLSMVSAPRLSA